MPMTSLGDFLVDQYLNDPATQEARFNGGSILFDPATEDPFTNAAVRERIFNALQGNTNTDATMSALQSPESTWQLGGSGYNASLNIPDAPDRNDGDFGDIMKFALMAGGLSGLGNMFAGNLGGLGGVDAGLLDTVLPPEMFSGAELSSGIPNLDTVIDFGVEQPPAPVTTSSPTTVNPNVSSTPNLGNIVAGATGSGALGNAVGSFTGNTGTNSGGYQFPWANVIGAIMEYSGQSQYRDDLMGLMNRALSESDPFKAQRPRYFEPLYQAATQGVGGTPYGEAIANSTLRKLSSTGDAGYDITGLGANTLAKNLNSASLDYVKALTPLTGASFQANTGAATNVGQQAAQAGMGQSGALGSAFSSIMSGNQPSSLERLFGGKQANQTFPQFLSSF